MRTVTAGSLSKKGAIPEKGILLQAITLASRGGDMDAVGIRKEGNVSDRIGGWSKKGGGSTRGEEGRNLEISKVGAANT